MSNKRDQKFRKVVARVIRREQDFCDLTNAQLADKSSVSESTIENIRGGSNARITTVGAVVRGLGLDYADFFATVDRGMEK